MKVKRRWIILMAAMTLIAIAGVFVGEPAFECDWSVTSDMGAAVGCVVGLVAITPSAGYVTVGQSIFIAFVITLICNIGVHVAASTMPSTYSPLTAQAVSSELC